MVTAARARQYETRLCKSFRRLHSNLYNALIFLGRQVKKKGKKEKRKLPKERDYIQTWQQSAWRMRGERCEISQNTSKTKIWGRLLLRKMSNKVVLFFFSWWWTGLYNWTLMQQIMADNRCFVYGRKHKHTTYGAESPQVTSFSAAAARQNDLFIAKQPRVDQWRWPLSGPSLSLPARLSPLLACECAYVGGNHVIHSVSHSLVRQWEDNSVTINKSDFFFAPFASSFWPVGSGDGFEVVGARQQCQSLDSPVYRMPNE